MLRTFLIPLLLSCGLALADTATLPPPPPPESDSLVSAKVESLGRRLDRDSAAAKSSSLVDGRSLGLLVVQILLALSVVTGLGFATVFAWSRMRRRNGNGQSGEIDILETRTLQPGRHLQLVRLHNRVVAIVTTAHGAAAVAEFRDNEAAEIIAELGAGSVSTKDFGAALDTLLERFRKPGSKGPEA